MLDERTAEIIMICKAQHDFDENLTTKDAIKLYMANRCGTKPEDYTERELREILWEAAKDYIDNIKDTKPSVFIDELFRRMDSLSFIDAVCSALRIQRVMYEGRYINGFTKENTQTVKLLTQEV